MIFLTFCYLPCLKDGKQLPNLTKICVFWQKWVFNKIWNSKGQYRTLSCGVIKDLLLQYIMPNRKISILTKLTEVFAAKYSAKYFFWIMNYELLWVVEFFFKKKIPLVIISIKLQVAERLLEVFCSGLFFFGFQHLSWNYVNLWIKVRFSEIWKKVSDFYLFFIWIKKLHVQDG